LNIYFLSFRNFEQLALALKVLKPGGRRPRPPPASCAYEGKCLLWVTEAAVSWARMWRWFLPVPRAIQSPSTHGSAWVIITTKTT